MVFKIAELLVDYDGKSFFVMKTRTGLCLHRKAYPGETRWIGFGSEVVRFLVIGSRLKFQEKRTGFYWISSNFVGCRRYPDWSPTTILIDLSRKMMTIFAIILPFPDESCSSSNSGKISMRRFCMQNFISIELFYPESSPKRPDTLTDSIVCSLFE